jgi:hypothetical protein
MKDLAVLVAVLCVVGFVALVADLRNAALFCSWDDAEEE